jgi:hypothetical protein
MWREHLADPGLTVDAIALALNCSRRQLYNAFAEEPDGVAGYILRAASKPAAPRFADRARRTARSPTSRSPSASRTWRTSAACSAPTWALPPSDYRRGAHATLPADKPLTEREVNEALKAALAGAACWLATDHVELRRWLVDAGWLTRDGYGREYRALAHAALPPAPAPHQALARALATMDVTRWVAAEREVQERMRAERKARWAAAQKG